jgi:prevent-host-death family protein
MITATAAQARTRFADLLHRVMDDGEYAILTHYGKPAVAMVPLSPRMLKLLQRAMAEERILEALADPEGTDDVSGEEVYDYLQQIHRK